MGTRLAFDSMGLAGRVAAPSALLNNIVSYWKLEEASGTRADSAPAGNNLTAVNTPGQSVGIIGNAVHITAANGEQLNHADNASLSTGDIDFSLACWVFLDSKGANRMAMAKLDASPNFEYYLGYISGVDRFEFAVSPDGTSLVTVDANNFGSPVISTWYFLTAWHDSVGNTINIQVNQTAVNSQAHATGVFDSGASFYIGANGNGNNMDGRLDESGFWKRVLGSSDRSNLYNGGAGLTYPFS